MTMKNNGLNRYTIVDWILLFIALAVTFIAFVPILYIFSASVSDPEVIYANPLFLLPQSPSLVNFQFLFKLPQIWIGYLNSFIYAIVGMVLNVSVTMLASYALSRGELFGRRVVNFLITVTMFVSGGMIPLFLVVRNLGLLDTRWAIWLPTLCSTWNLMIARTYLSGNVPGELHDAAEVDGASEARYFFQIVLPLSKPILAVLAMFYGSGHWNAYFNALIYLKNRNLFPLQLFLRELLLLENDTSGLSALGDMVTSAQMSSYQLTLKYAIMVIAILPILIVFPFVQKFLCEGVIIGSVKE